MLEDLLNAALVVVVAGPLTYIGVWLFNRGILRAWHLTYVVLPLSLTLAFLVIAVRTPLFSSWSTRLVVSVSATAMAMAPILVVMKMKGLSIDQLEKSWRSRKKGK